MLRDIDHNLLVAGDPDHHMLPTSPGVPGAHAPAAARCDRRLLPHHGSPHAVRAHVRYQGSHGLVRHEDGMNHHSAVRMRVHVRYKSLIDSYITKSTEYLMSSSSRRVEIIFAYGICCWCSNVDQHIGQ